MTNSNVFNYGDYVEAGVPMRIHRTYNKVLKNTYKWLGINNVTVSVPVYAKKVTVLKDIDVEKYIDFDWMEGAEVFLLNTEGEFIKIPSKMNAGRIFEVEGIEQIVVLPAEVAKKMDEIIEDYRTKDINPSEHWKEISKGFALKEQADNTCQILFDINGQKECFKYNELVFPKEFAYWSTNINEEELEKKVNFMTKNVLEELEYFNTMIEKTVQGSASAIKNGLTYSEAYGIKSVTELQDKVCKDLSTIVSMVIEQFKDFTANQKGIEFNFDNKYDLDQLLCSELKAIVANYIENNASWLKDKATDTVKTFLCGVLPIKIC